MDLGCPREPVSRLKHEISSSNSASDTDRDSESQSDSEREQNTFQGIKVENGQYKTERGRAVARDTIQCYNQKPDIKKKEKSLPQTYFLV